MDPRSVNCEGLSPTNRRLLVVLIHMATESAVTCVSRPPPLSYLIRNASRPAARVWDGCMMILYYKGEDVKEYDL